MIDKTDPTNRDTVPAMLTPGEFVLNKEATQMFGPVVEQMNNAGLQHRAMKNMGGDVSAYNDGGDVKISLQEGILETAKALGIDPVDLATIISYETAGTLSPTKKGPTTKWGQHRGYIQFGEPQAEEYGVDFSSEENAMSSQLGANGAIVKYFKAHGFEPGMGLLDLYSIVNTGGPGRYNWSDEKAGGAKGTVSDKVTKQMPAHRDNAIKLLGIDFAPETSIRPQARGEVPTQAVPEFVAQMDPQTVEQVSVPTVRPQMRPTPQAESLAIEQAVMQASVPQMQGVPPSPSSFGEAFKDARADMGAGGIFTFRGNDYTTDYAEEEDKRMTANMGGAVSLNMGGYPQGYLDNYRKGIMANMGPEYLARIEKMGGIDAVRELQAQVRPDYTPGNIEEDFASSEPMAYDDPALKAKSDGKIDLRFSDQMLDKNLYLSQPNTGMTTEESMAKRKNLAANSYVPMPKVNSDESLLQGSSQSVENATSSYLSDYSIMAAANMAVPKIPLPPPAPRPTMIGGKLYYLNLDGSVTDGNGDPVQDPSIGAAVQDKLNYSAEESAANAEAYNDSMAEQAVFNGVAPQSVNPSYDSMRRQQESNAAEAERIRKEIAKTDAKREALRVAYNNRDTPVVPQLESNSVPLNNLVPPNPDENDTRNLGGAEGYGPPSSPPKSFNPAFEGKDLEKLYNMFAVNGGQGSRADPTLAQALTKEIEAREAAGESFNVYDTSLQNAAALYLGGRNSPEIQRQQVVADRSSRNAEKAAAALAAQQAELQAKLDAGTVTQRDIDSFERQRRATTQAQAVAARNEETAKLTAEQQAALIKPATDIESDNTEATKALREAESKRLQSYDPITGTYSNTNEPKKSTGDVFSEVEVKVDEVQKTAQPTTPIQENAARKNADNVDLNKVDKSDQRVAGAMDTIKSVFGDLFDSKELVRAAVMYLGGRVTGMDNQQALAFAGKTYLAREEAKGVRTQKFVDKLISDGKHKMGSIAAYKKSLDPNDLELIGLTFLETGNTGTYYAPNAAGNFVTLQLKEMKGSDGGYYLHDSKGNSYDPAKLHQDPKRVKGTPEYDTALASQISLFKDTFDELRLQGGIVTNRMDGKPAVYKTDLNPSVVAADSAAWALRYGVPLEMVPSLMTEAYSLAKDGKDINGNPKRAQKIEPYLNQLWITQSAGDPNNFKIGKGNKAKFVETSTVSSWVTNVHNQMKEVNPEFNAVTPIRFSTWLRQTDISGQWSLPEEQGGLSQEARNEITKRGNAVGKSGYMQYILEEAAKNYEKSLNKPTT